ncbi:MAG: DNA-3-methyladenine glycosylase 2 family protein [Candidatus Marinimicrobia bacterium]|nr:DNA-3-methyladenine glycosylase 2 family protein [Candidatus Neomarinimicrobiota bacterium]
MAKPKSLSIQKAATALRKLDPEMAPLLDAFQMEDLQPETDFYRSLTRAIIYQQLSGKAAKTISDRFVALYKEKKYPSPKDVLKTDPEILRSVGLSNAKAKYIKNISEAFLDGSVDHQNLGSLSDDDIMNQLVSIKGVGPWTAQMFLMFTLNRPDIFPTGDLGVQKGFQQYFKLKELPSPKIMEKRSQKWKPHRTVASLFFWKVVDGPFEW